MMDQRLKEILEKYKQSESEANALCESDPDQAALMARSNKVITAAYISAGFCNAIRSAVSDEVMEDWIGALGRFHHYGPDRCAPAISIFIMSEALRNRPVLIKKMWELTGLPFVSDGASASIPEDENICKAVIASFAQNSDYPLTYDVFTYFFAEEDYGVVKKIVRVCKNAGVDTCKMDDFLVRILSDYGVSEHETGVFEDLDYVLADTLDRLKIGKANMSKKEIEKEIDQGSHHFSSRPSAPPSKM